MFFLLFWQRCQGRFTAKDNNRPGGSMRNLSTFVIVISMVASSAWAEPLAAGKPAGVRQAQDSGKEWLVFGGVGALAAGILIATAGGRSSAANQGQTITVVTTNATAT
jgi:hypothetical protein